MELQYRMEVVEGTAKIWIGGRLDATNALAFQDELKKIIGQDISRIMFFAEDLEYIASAGLRVMIFVKQRIGMNAQVSLIGARKSVLDVVKMSGLDTFMTIEDTPQSETE